MLYVPEFFLVSTAEKTAMDARKNRCGRQKKWSVPMYWKNATEVRYDFRHMRLFKTAAGTRAKGPVLGMGFSPPVPQKSGAELRKRGFFLQ